MFTLKYLGTCTLFSHRHMYEMSAYLNVLEEVNSIAHFARHGVYVNYLDVNHSGLTLECHLPQASLKALRCYEF